jgi:hypothetical protein
LSLINTVLDVRAEEKFPVINLFTALPHVMEHKECYSKRRDEEHGIQKTTVTAERYLVYGVKGNLFPFSVYTKNHLKCVIKAAWVIGLQNS